MDKDDHFLKIFRLRDEYTSIMNSIINMMRGVFDTMLDDRESAENYYVQLEYFLRQLTMNDNARINAFDDLFEDMVLERRCFDELIDARVSELESKIKKYTNLIEDVEVFVRRDQENRMEDIEWSIGVLNKRLNKLTN